LELRRNQKPERKRERNGWCYSDGQTLSSLACSCYSR
jgi:hypothetical protein